MTDDFYRIRRLPPYVFAEVNAMKAAARARGEDIVDLGMGNPDGAPPPHVIAKLAEVAAKPNAHRYSASKGIPGLRSAQAAYYQRRFDVALDPDREIIVTLGSKEGLANLAQAITAPGDVVLTPNPSYPIHHFGFIIAGASIRSIPAVPGPDFFDRLEKAMRYTVPRPKVLVIGYPSNPTAETVELAFYEQLVAFAREAGLWIISDLAYAEIYFGDTPTPSILQVEGAKDVAVEFTSMSKTYSMPGWRIGFAVGNAELIGALGPREILPRLWRLHPDPGRRHRRAQRPAGHHRLQPRALQEAPRRDGRMLRPRRLGHPRAAGEHVRLGADPRGVSPSRQHRIRQAPAHPRACRGRARCRVRRGRRGLRPPRFGRE